ncbi:hypothetical protein SLEP1_g6815 [Rubroshorea leprosula]|uniref:Integrase catalytic domain-containing protein n=1 Tax=Rubroshorea leprosula TaxID=152421 RepID=A0AAV5I112_9ROSI|nr:hypothetical protein SLEP1_g6815 [Rubroshorea leprosula]
MIYLKRFRDLALNCYGGHAESFLVEICINNMHLEYRVVLENIKINQFVRLLGATKKTTISVKAISARKSVMKLAKEKTAAHTFAILVRGQGQGQKKRDRDTTSPPPTPLTVKELGVLFKQWIADDAITLPQLHREPNDGDKRNRKATEAILSIANETKGECLNVEAHASRAYLESSNAITFIDEDMEAPYPDHRKHLYLFAHINSVSVRHAFVETGSSLNLISLSTIIVRDNSIDEQHLSNKVECLTLEARNKILVEHLDSSGEVDHLVPSYKLPTFHEAQPALTSLKSLEAIDHGDDLANPKHDLMLRLPTISVPFQGKTLKVYLSTSDKAVGALVAQDYQQGKEQPVYYVSWNLKGIESRYSFVEKICLALIYVSQHLRHCFLAHKIQLITKSQPIWYLLTRPMLIGHLSNWLLQLSQYDITCINPTAIKGQAVASLLFEFFGEVQYPISNEVPRYKVAAAQEIEEEWTLYFNGFSTTERAGASIVLRNDKGHDIVFSFKLDFQCTNNMADYEAYLIGLAMANEAGVQCLKIIGKSSLILGQVQDLIGPIHPPSEGYIWILVAIEYFTKWVEVVPLRKATGPTVSNFIKEYIICRFGIPYKIVSDNGTSFIYQHVRRLLDTCKIKHRKSTPYYPQGNGQVEAVTNKSLLRILSKMVHEYEGGWSIHLQDTL